MNEMNTKRTGGEEDGTADGLEDGLNVGKDDGSTVRK